MVAGLLTQKLWRRVQKAREEASEDSDKRREVAEIDAVIAERSAKGPTVVRTFTDRMDERFNCQTDVDTIFEEGMGEDILEESRMDVADDTVWAPSHDALQDAFGRWMTDVGESIGALDKREEASSLK